MKKIILINLIIMIFSANCMQLGTMQNDFETASKWVMNNKIVDLNISDLYTIRNYVAKYLDTYNKSQQHPNLVDSFVDQFFKLRYETLPMRLKGIADTLDADEIQYNTVLDNIVKLIDKLITEKVKLIKILDILSEQKKHESTELG